MDVIRLDESPSTNSYLAANATALSHGTVVTARVQTAGRGQRGNSWESAPGENITMSLLLRPVGLHPARQFVISQAVSLAIVDVLCKYLPQECDVRVKWPNDIYVSDRKICGILIEHSITSRGINHSIIGTGINVNQTMFLSDAPNPVSMVQLAGCRFDLEALTLDFARAIIREVDAAVAAELAGDSRGLAGRYAEALWRRDGFHPYVDNLAGGERIMARIVSVAPDGIITLALTDGSLRSYAFKEVKAIVGEAIL
ncbi:MAG: biotin--[acetyl-CoA-carboxylase] ligase [Staphylococcus sp.]|nr:biotin--[acetyl-CoA-carboxylase] ligase [Staphylococcus sp.]